MCWYTADLPEEKIADKDITCYKVVLVIDGLVKSYFQSFQYEYSTLYSLDYPIEVLLLYEAGVYCIYKAFHSYISKPSVDFLDRFCVGGMCYYKPPKAQLVRCTIPKGAHYYANETEYASDSIVINEIVEFNHFNI